jgi:poly(3-hydroxybutyrate) depolymerase
MSGSGRPFINSSLCGPRESESTPMKTRYSTPAGALACAVVALGLCSAGQARADYEANKYVEPGTNLVLEYNLYVPANLTAGSKYPLLVYLHAANDEAMPHRTLSSDGKGWVPQLMTADKAKTVAFYMIPISQTNASGWGDPVGPITDTEKFEGRLTVVALKGLLDKYPIDRDRLYVTGASMGARGTYDMLRRYPDLFAAGAPCASPASPADAAIYATQNIWAVMGSVDPVVQPNRDTIAAIRKVCGNPIYTELDGHGHDSWRSIYPMPEFIAWMFAQRRGVPWPQVSSAPTPAQILAAEQAPVKGLNASQAEVSVAPNCPVAGGGAASGGATSAAGAPGSAGAGGADLGSSGGQLGLGGNNDGSGGTQASGAAGSHTASGAPGVAEGGALTAIAGAPTAAQDPAPNSADGCTCAAVGRVSEPRSLANALTALAALAVLRARRRARVAQ